jgi:hypothetical protein
MLIIIEMKYLIVKGWLGFGDRMESLGMAVMFAQKFGLQIYVDWRDDGWSHGAESFYSYFSIVNTPVLNSLADIPEDATFYPPFWKDCIDAQITPAFIEAHKDENINLGHLTQPFDADVVVFSCISNRILYADYAFFANVVRVIDPRVRDKVRARQQRFALKNCVGVHIRGTDRVRNAQRRDLGIQHLAIRALPFASKPMVVVSDDSESTEVWKRFFPQSAVLSELSTQESVKAGNHNAPKEALKSTKDDLNVDMLADFFSLASCDMVMTTYRDSRFAAHARRLHPHVATMMSA